MPISIKEKPGIYFSRPLYCSEKIYNVQSFKITTFILFIILSSFLMTFRSLQSVIYEDVLNMSLCLYLFVLCLSVTLTY